MKHLQTIAATGNDGQAYTVGWWQERGPTPRWGTPRRARFGNCDLQLPGGEALVRLGKGVYEVPSTGVRLTCADPAAP